MIDELLTAGAVVVHWISDFANSNFMIALVGAAAGAAGGAYGAQWIVERSQRKSRALEEIRATNAAIMVAFGITNTFCALKNQHVRRLKDTFDRQRRELHDFAEKRRQRLIALNQVFEFQADFETLSLPPTQIEILQKLLFEKVSVTGRPLSLFTTLCQSIDGLGGSLRRRNEVIAHYKESSSADPQTLLPFYFGLPDGMGHTDLTYPTCVEAIFTYTDDCIFFSKKLIEDLVLHGRSLAITFGKTAPKIHEPDFAKAVQQKLIPDNEQYADWLSAFKPTPTVAKRSLSQSLKSGVKRLF